MSGANTQSLKTQEDENVLFLSTLHKIIDNTARPEEINWAIQYAGNFQHQQWADKLYAMLKQLFDRYSEDFLTVDEQAAADLITDYQTRNIP